MRPAASREGAKRLHRGVFQGVMTWPRRRLLVGILLAGVTLLVAGGAAWYFFAPKPTEHRQEAAPQGLLLKSGTFRDGDALHSAEGTVHVLEAGGRHVLRFEGYAATSGPDVYWYLTPRPHASTTEEVEGAGLKVRAPTIMGQATLRGDFNVELPEGTDVSAYGGIAIWCDTYNVLFGYAELAPA